MDKNLQYQLGITRKGQLWVIFCLILFALGTAFRVPLVWLLASLLLLPVLTYPYYLYSFLSIRCEIEWQVSSTAIRAESILSVNASIENTSIKPLTLYLTLDVSSSGYFIDNPATQRIRVNAEWISQCTWLLTFIERGKASVGPVSFGVGGFGGLFEFRQKVAGEPVELTVMARLPSVRLDEKAQRRIHGKMVGAFAQQVRGVGTDFHALRDYVPGDERKHISWKATARFSRLIAKEYELDQNLQALLMVDLGRNMEGAKLEYALTSAIEFGELLNLGHHEFGMILYSNKIEAFLRPGAGKQHQMQRLQATARVKSHTEPADFLQAVRFLIGQRFRRSLIVIISDMEGDHNRLQLALSELRIQHHIVIYVNLHTPSFGRSVQTLRDAETYMDPLRRQFVESILVPDIAYRYYLRERDFRRMLEQIGVHYFKVSSPRDSYLLEFEKWMRTGLVVTREVPHLSR